MKSVIEPSTLTSASFEDLVRETIVRLGEDPQREGLERTPERVHKAMQYLTKGYQEDPETLFWAASLCLMPMWAPDQDRERVKLATSPRAATAASARPSRGRTSGRRRASWAPQPAQLRPRAWGRGLVL